MLPDEQTHILTTNYGLSLKDSKTMVELDNGKRLDYFYDVASMLVVSTHDDQKQVRIGKIAANWYGQFCG